MGQLLKMIVFVVVAAVTSFGCQPPHEETNTPPALGTDMYATLDSYDLSRDESPSDYDADQDIECRPCPDGFLPGQGCTCQDVDECSLGVCDGVCTNTTGGFECSPDVDGDGITDLDDNCVSDVNTNQIDLDGDTLGDACDDDDDGDGVDDAIEADLGTNPQLPDTDADGIDDFYELQCSHTDDGTQCPDVAPDTVSTGTPDALNPDVDGDGHLDGVDNCFATPNPEQMDTDADGIGNLCDDDVDGDRVVLSLDCDDNNPRVGAVVFDQDCDGARELSRTSGRFSAGWQTTCGILDSGDLRCFGTLDSLPLTPPRNKDGSEYRDWIEVSAGNDMACAIHANGRMSCFGARAPTPPVDERGQQYADWYTVDVGGDSTPYACAIRVNGQLYCFGAHRAFEPLTGHLATHRNWVSVTVGVRHGCARSGDGEVMCFGENNFGQGTPPAAYAGRWIEMDGGYAHTCGRIDSGEMICFGINSDEQLDVPLTENDGPILDWKSVSVGGFAGCGIRGDEEILCWGSNYYGQNLIPDVPLPWTGVRSGRYHTCGQLNDGSLKCWGWNSRGERDVPTDLIFQQADPLDNCPGLPNPEQLDMDGDQIGDLCDDDRDGDGLSNEAEPSFGLDPDTPDSDGDGVDDGIEYGCDPTCPPEPLNTNDDSPIDALNNDSDADGVLDTDDNCRILSNPQQDDADRDGVGNVCDVDIDGDGIRGQFDCDDQRNDLGLQSRDPDCDGVENYPILTDRLLITGESITCIFDASGALKCAGQDHYEQTRIPTDTDGWTYRDWRSADVAFSHGCATRLNGEMHCWGANYDGRGSPPAFDNNGQTIEWAMVTTGFAHTCGLSTQGHLFCFGGNYDGQCDVPQEPSTGMPYRFKTIDAGAFHNCGLTLDDRLVCFGSRNSLQRPTAVSETDRFSQVAASREHSCALRLAGDMHCWARNGFMEVPTHADGSIISDWVDVVVGRYHTCGLRTSGQIQCFGVDLDGQHELQSAPHTFIAVAAGGRHTCGIDDQLTLHCVGADDLGQVSGMNGQTVYSSSGPDNCPETQNPSQEDENDNGVGDDCELD